MPHTLPAGLRPGGRFDTWRRPTAGYVVADVDGTLILEGSTATPGVAAAVADATAAGLRVGFATGRLPAGLRDLHDQLRVPGPHIVHNGAQVREAGLPIHTWSLDRPVASALVDWCVARGLYAEFYLGEEFVVTERQPAAQTFWDLISGDPHGVVGDIDWRSADVIKATVVAYQGRGADTLLAGLRALGLTAETSTSPVFPGDQFINVTSPQADKGRAVRWAAGYLGIGIENVVAVGDGPNDLSMLTVAGTAIAMGQAPAVVQQAAHLVVPEVAADGVAHALAAAASWLA
ncbi:HAD family hydrolase [Nakamurella deserti]|uniref:HAD family hydrolase n=1 Tax=Nakamurella deserti TaxID=2164074 RepID=UPI000DBE57E7|nr:HAD family hydrolase [Nakamurella deserti]